MNTELEQELRAWLQPVSPLVTFAKSLKNEVGSGDPKENSSKTDKGPANPWEGIDFDELPDDLKKKLEGAKSDYDAKAKAENELKTKLDGASKFAREQQARADRLDGVLKHHNIGASGDAPKGKPASGEERMVKMLLDDGLPEAQAKAYGKMLAKAGDAQREQLYQELGPLLGTVGNIQADQFLRQAKEADPDSFAIPEIEAEVTKHIKAFIANGTPIQLNTIENLRDMAVGKLARTNPEKFTKKEEPRTQLPTMRSSLRNGITSPTPRTADGKPPTPQDPETAKAVREVVSFFDNKPAKKSSKFVTN